MHRHFNCLQLVVALALGFPILCEAEEPIPLQLSFQVETTPGSGKFHRLTRKETWKPAETAIIVCDVWDYHHCLNAVRRLEEFAPRLDSVLQAARENGVTIIHSPSDCMEAYREHPARLRAATTAAAGNLPHDVRTWCSLIPSEERAVYPIDQSDGGEDDDPAEHAAWAAKLESLGRNPNLPWKRQSPLITIDADRDFISDRGDEVWNVLESKSVKNVILTGVHTNMCVLGRPFGLRQMARNGKNVVLMRDMTDTMYNPKQWPFVNHYEGTERVLAHVERFVCPTITSDQILGGETFQFKRDTRKRLAILIAEDEYETAQTLPDFAAKHLSDTFRVDLVFGSAQRRNQIPGLTQVEQADALLVSVRRRVLPPDELAIIRGFVEAGKPVIGIRTASHAFSLRNSVPDSGHVDWPEFDAEVFGGNYSNHHGNKLKAEISWSDAAASHPITRTLAPSSFVSGGSLYKTSPLRKGATVLAEGKVAGQPPEPIAWTFARRDGGRSFYTSLGHRDDFANPQFVAMLRNGILWAAGTEPVFKHAASKSRTHWTITRVPETVGDVEAGHSAKEASRWYRCVVRIPSEAKGPVQVRIPGDPAKVSVWWNGESLKPNDSDSIYSVTTGVEYGDANLLVVRLRGDVVGLHEAPAVTTSAGNILLRGRWQYRVGSDDANATLPLPAKFAAGTDVVYMADGPLWTARPLSRSGQFTAGIEGPACDAAGNIFAVNFARQGTIGRVRPDGAAELFVELPEGSIGNGIRFGSDGSFYVADYTKHNVLRVDPKTRKVTVFAHDDGMNQPNDLAIAPNGTLYASDPAWAKQTGQLWRIDKDGTITRIANDMGTTNGVEVSPDGKTLYVNESVQRNVWAFPIKKGGELGEKRLLKKFDDHGFDGMRCDVDGNLYITRHGKGTVVKLSPDGKILREIHVLGDKPTNICFGGRDGKTAYVTEVEHTRIVTFRVDRPGRSWQEQHTSK